MASITAPVSQDASSLRAAALLTIRSKARPRYQSSGEDRPPQDHLDDASSVASTRRIAPSPELNYGSDDGLADAEGSTEEEEEGEKEEGEISDDDVTPAKTSPITMDVDNEPLPGLASSSSRTWYLEDTSGLQSKNHLRTSPVPPSTYPSTKPASRIFEQPHTTTSFTGTLDTTPLSTVPTGSGDHALNQSPVLKRPASPRNPPASSKSSAPSSHLPNASFSRFLSPQAETDRHGSDSAAEQAKVTGLSSHPSSSRQVTSKFDVPSTDTTLIRPSLNMTVEDFMEAKTIILDLLGWGVPSEYFIHCGLTREAIFYAFTEMNLKLPTNLNIQGIIPYEPPADYVSDSLATTDDDQAKKTALLSIQPTEKTNALNSATNSVQTDRRASGSGHVKLGIISTASPHPLPPRPASIATPPLTSITSSISSGDVGNTQPQPLRSSQGGGHLDASSNQSYHDSSSPNDPIPGLQAEFSRSTIPPKSTRSSSYSMGDAPLHGYSGNLDEIETLRRQELQARKAVLASRKPKLGAYNSVVKSAAGVVPSSLNVEISGTDSPSTGSPPRSLLGVSGQRVPIPADTVDEFLKSIASGPSASGTGDDSGLIPALTRSPDSMDIDVDPSPHDGPADAHTPFSTGASTVDSQSALEQQPPFSSRKSSMKRPVASDFVDYDSISRESPFASSTSPNVPSNGWGKGSLSSTPSFANLLPTRKIIIDFSDSEEEDTVEASNALISEEQRCLPASIAMHILAPASTGSTNAINTPASLPSTPVPTLSATGIPPEALLLKEQEIKRMKELIAEREKNRLKKLANLPKSVTPPPHPRSSSTAILEIASKPVNEEITSATAENYDGMIIAPTTAARESSTTSVAGDILEENAVMHDIFAADVSVPDISTTSTPPSTDASNPETQDAATGEHVLTAEAGHEQVVECETSESINPPQHLNISLTGLEVRNRLHCLPTALHLPMVCAQHSLELVNTSLQVKQDISRRFSAYNSPLTPFVSFRLASRQDDCSTLDTFVSSLPLTSLDTPASQQLSTLLRPLKEGTLHKVDPKRVICQFEIPGAGKCRDSTCPNVHLRAFEPNDDETARYLAKVLPAPQPTAQEVKAALSRVRASHQDLDLDARVFQTLLQLDVR